MIAIPINSITEIFLQNNGTSNSLGTLINTNRISPRPFVQLFHPSTSQTQHHGFIYKSSNLRYQ